MWIGLLDQDKKSYHPTVVGRVDSDLVVWKFEYLKAGWLRLSNRNELIFLVHKHIVYPHYYGFFRDIDDAETFYFPIPLTVPTAWRDQKGELTTMLAVKAGDQLHLAPGDLKISLPGPAKKS